MIITTDFLKELFRGFTVLRWNDKIRPMDFPEIDKHAHKMIIAYCIGKYEESIGKTVNWDNIIRGGIFELLRRIVISDIKSPIFYKIKSENQKIFYKLCQWVYKQLEPIIEDKAVRVELRDYLLGENPLDPFSLKILDAAHKYASYWEFQMIKQANPNGFQIDEIERALLAEIDYHLELVGIRKIVTRQRIADFVDLCGQLRFQVRWAQTSRLPKTSVLGHTMFVACLSYFFARDNNACQKRIYNDFFGGLFHDLPEAVTRDIISPLKKSNPMLGKLLKSIEVELAEKEIYPMLEAKWIKEIKYFTQDEFKNKIVKDNIIHKRNITVEDINQKYNDNIYNPIDGEMIKAADDLAAYLECWHSINYGIRSEYLEGALNQIRSEWENRVFGNVRLKTFYSNLK